MHKGFFITGTDTDIGKTWVSVALMRFLKSQGYSVAGMKPVSAGCKWQDGGWQNEDALMLQANSTIKLPYSLVNPYAFELPVSPHLAADGVMIEESVLLQAFSEIKKQTELVCVEGAGGWLVPITMQYDMADLARAMGLPVILVVGIKLGCLNHARLTMQAIESADVECVGWVANCLTPDMTMMDENIATLSEKLSVPLLAVLPFMQTSDFDVLAESFSNSGL